jgi:hypothetical protein
MIDSAKLINLAARGIPNIHISKALGISDGRVSQLLADERVAEKVKEKEAELASKDLDALTSLETINQNLLTRIECLAEDTDSLGEAVIAYERLSKIQSSKRSANTESEDGIRNITIQAPTFIQQTIQITTSAKNEIIDINARPMTTMPTVSVHKLIKDHAKTTAADKDLPLDDVEF